MKEENNALKNTYQALYDLQQDVCTQNTDLKAKLADIKYLIEHFDDTPNPLTYVEVFKRLRGILTTTKAKQTLEDENDQDTLQALDQSDKKYVDLWNKEEARQK